ncbi:unnamed protein product [Bursaphelenchus xylophilus]|uniref:(pine wood nematode) hypothetical protein n=1 Tax=Bursaphelenchus xylophilus TaxID=6326 RepID=A0A7I8XAS0_BURXY|nr:unnamed protein product [Bursaphelenchus xylophilus]CAG9132023.1 unnamed protein product [Bursaphelenchus xylophilus]
MLSTQNLYVILIVSACDSTAFARHYIAFPCERENGTDWHCNWRLKPNTWGFKDMAPEVIETHRRWANSSLNEAPIYDWSWMFWAEIDPRIYEIYDEDLYMLDYDRPARLAKAKERRAEVWQYSLLGVAAVSILLLLLQPRKNFSVWRHDYNALKEKLKSKAAEKMSDKKAEKRSVVTIVDEGNYGKFETLSESSDLSVLTEKGVN